VTSLQRNVQFGYKQSICCRTQDLDCSSRKTFRCLLTTIQHTVTQIRLLSIRIAVGVNNRTKVNRCVTQNIGHVAVQSVKSSASRRLGQPYDWDFWWMKWHRDRFVYDYIAFLLSVSFHQCPILPYSSITDTVQPYQLTASLIHSLNITFNLI
jgi:hypothetical protein